MSRLKSLFTNTPLVLAPMEEITDSVFREICKMHGADIVVTEFISSEALSRDVEKSLSKMNFSENERPLGIQIFGSNVDAMVEAARMAERANPEFIDINWGCPVKKVVSKGAGSAILKDIPKMIEITKAVVDAVKIPVSVKTRLGWEESHKPIVDVALRLQDIGIEALTIHGRTRSQMYSGKADWTLIGEVKNHPQIDIPIIGNGDIVDGKSAKTFLEQTNVDALMIGRATMGNPWIFRQVKAYLNNEEFSSPKIDERVEMCKYHLNKSIELKGERRAILEMRRHYSPYFRGLYNFKPYKIALMEAIEKDEVFKIFDDILLNYSD
ncbi:MAG: tRNA dihydrouridine synthase DusB [Bacteroidales bacterium]|nr:tRNA dihydrouridine synthase DusB [Bacteroidales bacterium]